MKKSIKWYMIVTGGILFILGLLFLIKGQNLRFPVTEVLTRVITPFRAMMNDGMFFKNDEYVSYFGGIERYFYPSEWKLYTWIYMSLPPFSAYVAARFLSILLSIFGTVLLISELKKNREEGLSGNETGTAALGWLLGLSYGLVAFPPFSSFGFASLPLLFFLLFRVTRKPRFGTFLLILLYPVLSDLYTTGILVFAGTLIFFAYRWISKKKFPWQVIVSFFLLAAGFLGTEYHVLFEFVFEDHEYVVFHWDRFWEALCYYPAFLLYLCLLAFFLFILRKGKEKAAGVMLVLLAILPLCLP
ncbi:MAG: hypothetical protein IK088_06305, partial [Lachnospiraceae bacterium]|nr:hypothetical protein [Lachnospiraceae bacterium]